MSQDLDNNIELVFTLLVIASHRLVKVLPPDNDANFGVQRHMIPKKHWTFLENVQHVLNFAGSQTQYGESFN
ncbi:hypothetical protein EVAR_4106_1 [Eumeta japonica]|uniref:Uncharacterized protein n=1 Tax=Eumeta variegata TaxID=151549 RepID=A0A4C1T4W5_EUMVA|nr:hypothetical protein EVAR_4106_1 [Eumeta japonica]